MDGRVSRYRCKLFSAVGSRMVLKDARRLPVFGFVPTSLVALSYCIIICTTVDKRGVFFLPLGDLDDYYYYYYYYHRFFSRDVYYYWYSLLFYIRGVLCSCIYLTEFRDAWSTIGAALALIKGL